MFSLVIKALCVGCVASSPPLPQARLLSLVGRRCSRSLEKQRLSRRSRVRSHVLILLCGLLSQTHRPLRPPDEDLLSGCLEGLNSCPRLLPGSRGHWGAAAGLSAADRGFSGVSWVVVCSAAQKDSPVLCWAGCVYHWGLRRHKPPVLASREPPLSGAGPLVLMSGDLPIVAPVPKWGADFPLCHFSIPSVPGGYRRAGPECLCLPVMAQQKPPPGCQDNVSEGGLFLEETVNLS